MVNNGLPWCHEIDPIVQYGVMVKGVDDGVVSFLRYSTFDSFSVGGFTF